MALQENSERWGNGLIAACCTLFVGVVVTPTGVYEGIYKLALTTNAAAWVQAVGSVGAIAATGFAAVHAIGASERAGKIALIAKRQSACAMAQGFLSQFEWVMEEMERRPIYPPFLRGAQLALQTHQKVLASFPVDALVHSKMIEAFVDVIGIASFAIDIVDDASKPPVVDATGTSIDYHLVLKEAFRQAKEQVAALVESSTLSAY